MYYIDLYRYLIGIRERVLCTDLLSEKDRVRIKIEEPDNHASKEHTNTENTENQQIIKDRNIKLKGQNKHRPPPMKTEIADKICPSLVNVGVGEDPPACPYAPKCSFRHDLKEYMEQRKPDLIEGGCYNYRTSGRCPRGISCLFGDEHVTPDGKNLEDPNVKTSTSQYFNFLSKELQHRLRKKTYSFEKSEKIAKSITRDKNKTPSNDKAHQNGTDEPSAKKVCLEPLDPVKDEAEVITLKPDEKKKVKKLSLHCIKRAFENHHLNFFRLIGVVNCISHR